MKRNYWLDWTLFILVVICAGTGIVMDFHLFSGGKDVKILLTDWHKDTGYLKIAGLLFHLAWHMGWIKNVTRLMFGSKNVKNSEA